MAKKKVKAKKTSTKNREIENANEKTQQQEPEIDGSESETIDDEFELPDETGFSEPDGGSGSSEPVPQVDVAKDDTHPDTLELSHAREIIEQLEGMRKNDVQAIKDADTALHLANTRIAKLEADTGASSIIRPEVPDFTELKGVPSFKEVFAVLSDQRIAYTFRKYELAAAAEFYGIQTGSRIRELELVGKLRTHITTRTCNCTDEELLDTRWYRVDEGEPIYIGLGPRLAAKYGGWFTDGADWLVSEIGSDKLRLEIGPLAQMPNSTPDVYAELDPLDGPLGTMGVAHRFEQGQLDRGEPPYAYLQFDSAENWYYELMVYVVAHELGHVLGVGHGPINNIMYASVPQRLQEHLGAWDKQELNGRIPRTVNEAIT